jgi:hypothetical protein
MQLQGAADAAAMGALFALERGASASSWLSAGRSDAKLNGFTNGQSGVVVNIVNPPATGLYTLNYGAVQATVSQPVTPFFIGQSVNVTAQAVALMPPCAYLSTARVGAQSLYLQSASVYATCPVYDSPSVYVDGFSTLRYDSNYVTGSAAASGGGGYIYNPSYNFPAMADPLGYVTSPAFSSCDITKIGLALVGTAYGVPGTYCNLPGLPGLVVGTALLPTTLYLYPGLYIITGGMSITNATLNLAIPGSGVTIFLTKRTDLGLLGTYGQVVIQGGLQGSSQINLSAPADSSYGGVPGILIFGDRNWVNTSVTNQDLLFANCSFNGDGIFYFPKTGIYDYQCPMNPPNYLGLVLDNLGQFVGVSVQPRTNFSSLAGGNPFRPRESLAE